MLLLFGELYAELEQENDGCLRSFPGGAMLRQVRAARAAGARLRFLGRVGRDDYGRSIRAELVEAGVEAMLQEDDDHPTSLLLAGGEQVAYRSADAQLQPPGDAFFEGGTLLHAGSWIFGLDPGRTTAVEVFREGLRRGLTLSLDLRVARWAGRGELEEVLRPYLPLGYMKVDAETAAALGIKPGELFKWAGQVLYFDGGSVRRLSLFEEKSYRIPSGTGPDEVYGRFLALASAGEEAEAALTGALASLKKKKRRKPEK
ncbi:carbohydrate kinase family protein [Oceanithermus sp.]